MDGPAIAGPSRVPAANGLARGTGTGTHPTSQSTPSSTASTQPPVSLPPSVDPRKLLTPAAVKTAIAQLDAHTHSLDEQLAVAIQSSMSHIDQSRFSIAAMAPQVDLLREEAGVLETRLVDAAQTSERISAAVRDLDEERRRVRNAAEWVRWAQDLKASLASLSSAVDHGDWESAIRHTQKAMLTPEQIIDSEFANRVVPSTEQPLAPAQTLLELRTRMLRVFTRQFDHAIEAKDQAEASRFFRMFPLVGWHDEGLAVYCKFARSMIREKGVAMIDASTRPSQSPIHHAQILTALFEQLAMLIDTHQGVVDRHYGRGNFAKGVMPGLQEECDRIGTRVLDNWVERTQIMRKVSRCGCARTRQSLHTAVNEGVYR